MKIVYQDKNFEITPEKKEDNLFSVKINEEMTDFNIIPITENIYRISENNKNQLIYIASNDENYYIFVDGELIEVQKQSETDIDIERTDNSINKLILKPPMPGSIVKVEVEIGQEINEGEPLIILEAMKMETTLYSSITGIVTEVNVKAGEQVPADKVLIVVEKK